MKSQNALTRSSCFQGEIFFRVSIQRQVTYAKQNLRVIGKFFICRRLLFESPWVYYVNLRELGLCPVLCC